MSTAQTFILPVATVALASCGEKLFSEAFMCRTFPFYTLSDREFVTEKYSTIRRMLRRSGCIIYSPTFNKVMISKGLLFLFYITQYLRCSKYYQKCGGKNSTQQCFRLFHHHGRNKYRCNSITPTSVRSRSGDRQTFGFIPPHVGHRYLILPTVRNWTTLFLTKAMALQP